MQASASPPARKKISKVALIAVISTIVAVIIIGAVIAVAVVVVNTNNNYKKKMATSTLTELFIPTRRIIDEKVPKYMKRKQLLDKPSIDLFENFITPEDAKYVITLAQGRFKPSTTLPDSKPIVSTDRTSTSVFLNQPSDSSDPVLTRIRNLASHIVDIPPKYMEKMQVVKYCHGQFYKQHYDYLNDKSEEVKKYGQRTATVLVYLNTLADGEGGGTKFHVSDLVVQPRVGSAVMWFNVTPAGHGDARTLHSGEPITTPGVEKYAMNIWFRDRVQR